MFQRVLGANPVYSSQVCRDSAHPLSLRFFDGCSLGTEWIPKVVSLASFQTVQRSHLPFKAERYGVPVLKLPVSCERPNEVNRQQLTENKEFAANILANS